VLDFLNNNPAIVAICTLAVSVGLVIFGWRVLFDNAQKLASRNETYNFVSQLLSLLDELSKEAIAHWVSCDETLNSQLQSKKLVSKTQRFKRKLALLKSRGLEFDCNKELKEIRRAITLDAERANDISDVKKKIKIDDINHYGAELTDKVLTAYQTKYPMN
jgi:hypothetical protein